MPRQTTDQTDQKEAAPHEPASTKSTATSRYGDHAPYLVVIAVLLGVILLGGAFAAGRNSTDWAQRPKVFSTNGPKGIATQPEFGRHMVGDYLNSSDRVLGVVTNVGSNQFTVAGNGSTKDVLTNSSTQYSGGGSVKTNDTVIVFGTTTNNQFTADRVVINP